MSPYKTLARPGLRCYRLNPHEKMFEFGTEPNVEKLERIEGMLLDAAVADDPGHASIGIPPHRRLEVQLSNRLVVVRLIDPHADRALKSFAGLAYGVGARATIAIDECGIAFAYFEERERSSSRFTRRIPDYLKGASPESVIGLADQLVQAVLLDDRASSI